MPIPSGVDQKKSKVYVQKTGGDYIQILPESFCESEILEGSMWPVSSHALKQYSNSIEERIAPFAGATANKVGKIGTVPEAKSSERTYFLRGDGKWVQIVITDEKVKAIKDAAKKFYLTGTDTNIDNVGVSYFDAGVYVSANAGELCATKFKGSLEGNVKGNLDGTAAKATADANGNNIANTYATKAALQSGYAPLGHKHNASEINALTGYAKGTSTAAIAASDTLNQALGKLEKKLDGMATLNSPAFTGTPTTPNIGANSGDTQIANKKYVDDKISGLINGAGSSLDTLKELANAIDNNPNFASSVASSLAGKLDTSSSNYVKSLSISNNPSGSGQILKVQTGDADTFYNLTIRDTTYTPASANPKAPGTATPGTSVKYAREDHVHPVQTTISGKAGSAGTADKLTTPRTINGVSFDGSANITIADNTKVAKAGDTMTGVLNTTVSGSAIRLHSQNMTKGTAPSSNQYEYIEFFDKVGKRMGLACCQYNTNKHTRFYIGARKSNEAGDTEEAVVSAEIAADGTKYGTAPTPASATDNSTKIATTAWVRTATGNFACNAATATTATKFASARSVTLTGAISGTASSQADWSIGTIWRSCMVGQSSSTNTNPWYKVATFAATGANDDIIATFLVEDTYSSHKQGILKVHVRTNASKVVATTASDLIWLSHTGYALADFVLVCPTAASSTVEIWTKIATAYMHRRFTVLSEGSRSATSIRWTLLNASSAGQAPSITTAGTQIASTFTGQAATCAGNATSATKLATARTINGTAFDGTANITTANWGTARNVSISDATGANTGTAVSVNGSANVTLKLPATIKANINGNVTGSAGSCTGTAEAAKKLATARSLWGNSFDGTGAIAGTISGVPAVEFKPSSNAANHGGYLDFHYNQSTADYTSRIIESASGTLSINNVTITTGKVVTAATFKGNLTGNVTGNVSGSSGSCTGNAKTATTLQTPRKINGVSFDGSTDITVADNTKVAKAGDTMTGNLIIAKSNPLFVLKATNIIKNTPPSASYAPVAIEHRDNANSRLWGILYNYNTDKTSYVRLIVNSGTTTDNTWTGIGVGYDKNGNWFTYAPTPAAGDNTTKIATTAFVNTKCGNYLPLAGGTMTGNLTVPSVIVSGSFVKQHPSITKGTNPSATQYWTLTFSDKNGSNYSNNCLGMLETSITSAGVVSTYIRAMKNAAANSSNCQISCIYDTANNTAYTSAPTPATGDNSTKIATTAFVNTTVNNKCGNYLPLTGGTMTGQIAYKVGSITRGTAPSASQYPWNIRMVDSAGKTLTGLYYEYFTDKSAKTHLMCYQGTTNDNNTWKSIGIGYDASGNPYTWALTPATADNSTKIATTAFVKAQGYITGSGNAGSADKLSTPRSLYVNLNSEYNSSSPVTFDGLANKALPITGSLPIAHGGTGATTRLTAIKALTNENVSTNATHFLGLKSDWSKVGYVSVADTKTVLGLDKYLLKTGGTLTGNVAVQKTSITRGSSTTSVSTSIHDVKDSAGNRVGLLQTDYASNKSSLTALYAYNTTTATGNSIGKLGIGTNTEGKVYTVAPTPASTTDSSTQIATTAWIRSSLGTMVADAGGLKVASQKLAVKCKTGGGLSSDSDGLYVDFSSANAAAGSAAADAADRMRAQILSSLGLQLPLTKDLNVYVNPLNSASTDSWRNNKGVVDTSVGTADKPFKTIQAAVNYVTQGYSVGQYVVTIYVNSYDANASNYNLDSNVTGYSGTNNTVSGAKYFVHNHVIGYMESVQCPSFNVTTGRIDIRPINYAYPVLIDSKNNSASSCIRDITGKYRFLRIHCRNNINYDTSTTLNSFPGTFGVGNNGYVGVYGCIFTSKCLVPSHTTGHWLEYRLISVNGGSAYFRPLVDGSNGYPNEFYFEKGVADDLDVFEIWENSLLDFPSVNTLSDGLYMIAEGSCGTFIACSGIARATGGGLYAQSFRRWEGVDTAAQYNLPANSVNNATSYHKVKGKKYIITNGGHCASPRTGFPGDQNGTVSTETYSAYTGSTNNYNWNSGTLTGTIPAS